MVLDRLERRRTHKFGSREDETSPEPRRKIEELRTLLNSLDDKNVSEDTQWVELLSDSLAEKELEKECVEGIIKKISSFGLDGRRVFEDWKNSFSIAWTGGEDKKGRKYSREEDFSRMIENNFHTMLGVDQVYPGAVKALNEEFDISDFGRYSEQTLVAQYELRNEEEIPYGVLAYPKGDWDGAFYRTKDMIENLRQQLEELGFGLRITECKNAIRVYGNLRKMHERYNESGANPIQFAVAGGHGTQSRVDFGIDSPHGLRDLSDQQFVFLWTGDEQQQGLSQPQSEFVKRNTKSIKDARSFFSQNMPLVIISCRAGADSELGIAKLLSEALDVKVIASKRGLRMPMISINAQLVDGKLDLDTNYPEKAKFSKGIEVGE